MRNCSGGCVGGEVSKIQHIIDNTIGKEGAYSNHPSDLGGPTKWGITEEVARSNGYRGDMRDMPRSEAVRIFRSEYLVKPGFDKLIELSLPIAEELFDTGVNMGVEIAGGFLQRALNAFNQQGKLYPDLERDGIVGKNTRDALQAYLKHRSRDGELVMLTALNSLQGERYVYLCERREKNEDFVFGWFLNRVVI